MFDASRYMIQGLASIMSSVQKSATQEEAYPHTSEQLVMVHQPINIYIYEISNKGKKLY